MTNTAELVGAIRGHISEWRKSAPNFVPRVDLLLLLDVLDGVVEGIGIYEADWNAGDRNSAELHDWIENEAEVIHAQLTQGRTET